MTTFFLTSDVFTRPSSGLGITGRNLLDRFWAAVHLDSPRSPKSEATLCGVEDSANDCSEELTPEIFAKTGSTPTVDVKSVCSGAKDEQDHVVSPTTFSPTTWSNLIWPPQIYVEPPIPPLAPQSHSRLCASSQAISSPSRTAPQRPKVSIPERSHCQGPSTASPATAILALASNFLDSIVQLTKSESIASNTTVIGREEGDIEIVDSEVHVNVIEEGKRAGVCSMYELQDDNLLQKLDIPPLSILGTQTANYDMASPYTVNGLAECAQELDALSQMSWERQLCNLQGSVCY